ncbi:MAG: NusG domain II-containing protein [Firmicutes bacterium]|nr:NusG domain II-containing protein [Bacillota bacterium]
MSKTDRILLFLLFVLALACWVPSFLRAGRDRPLVRVELAGRMVQEFPLWPEGSPPRRVKVPLAKGEALLSLENGGVRILPLPRSICPRRICAHSGLIRRPGETLVCVPNRLVVRIVDERRAAAFDAVAR